MCPIFVTNARILSAISPVGVFRIDTSGTITYANSKWRDITCIDESLDDSTGEVFLAAVHPDDREYMRQLWETALENTESCTFEARWGSSKNFRWAMGEVVPEVIGEHVHLTQYFI